MCSILSNILQRYEKPEAVKIKNPERVEELIKNMAADGPGALQMITDFDMTLTRFHQDGEKCDTCHGILHSSSLMSEEFKKRSQDLFNKYYPIEIDHTMTVEEKIPYMLKWYEESHETLTTFPFEKKHLTEMVKTSRILFRDGAVEMLEALNEKQVPVMVFSAGVGDILEEVLRKFNSYHSNTKVVSNSMEFNDEGRLIGFKGPLIHMFNKNEKAIRQSQPKYFENLSHRGNVLLLGDSLGDVDMVEGVMEPGAVIKIGFLNTKIEERLESFMNSFDIVLIDDQSMDFINLILTHVLKLK
ncbi:unnamed protein product [Allacma fusca]|uniref:5'-nucleotidase n=1 Tax=Allacma fusca TaxID=39272 RepID=A0A8J2KQS9_9HEXA|nr:unnamed protein product [Allacma fusca]